MRVWLFGADGCSPLEKPDVQQLLKDESKIFWVDLCNDEEQTAHVLRDIFQFHPLAVEDVLNERQRPKVEEYENNVFAILNPVQFHEKELAFRELDVFVGKNFIVTIHDGSEDAMVEETLRLINNRATFKLPMSSGYLLYVLVDVMVDSYFPLLDAIGDHIDEISEAILGAPKTDQLAALFHLKRKLSEMTRVVGQQRDMFGLITREDEPFINSETLRYYFRDVYDHLLRVNDTVNSYRDNVGSVIDLYLSSVSNRLNIIVKRLTVVTIASSALAVITGFYGMNFDQTFPSFDSPWGVPFVVILMIVVALLVLVLFYKRE